jgi:hypothetical protein
MLWLEKDYERQLSRVRGEGVPHKAALAWLYFRQRRANAGFLTGSQCWMAGPIPVHGSIFRQRRGAPDGTYDAQRSLARSGCGASALFLICVPRSAAASEHCQSDAAGECVAASIQHGADRRAAKPIPHRRLLLYARLRWCDRNCYTSAAGIGHTEAWRSKYFYLFTAFRIVPEAWSKAVTPKEAWTDDGCSLHPELSED